MVRAEVIKAAEALRKWETWYSLYKDLWELPYVSHNLNDCRFCRVIAIDAALKGEKGTD